MDDNAVFLPRCICQVQRTCPTWGLFGHLDCFRVLADLAGISPRRAVTGSTRVARYAGMQVARNAAVLNTITVDANTAGSRASTPNSRLLMKDVTVSATAMP